jgi:hypothetical protein
MAAHDVAVQWYFDLLKAELDERGSGHAAEFLESIIRVREPAENPTSGDVTLTIQQRLSDYEVRLNSETGELISWFLDVLATGGDTSFPPDEALQLAWRAGNVPSEGAELEISGYETMADRTFFRARWKHFFRGLEVEGDYIEVLINGAARRPFSVSRVWRDPHLAGPPLVR